jgi:hypothetical protein
MDEKVGVAVAASAVVFSPKVRSLLHRGAVLGVSGILVGADMLFGFLRGVRSGVTGNGVSANGKATEGGMEIDEEENGAPAARRRRPARAGAS